MVEIDLNLLSIVIFVIVLALIVYKDRRKIKRESILLLRRTDRGKEFIIRLANRFPRFWKVIGSIGVVTGFIVSVWAFVWLAQNLVRTFSVKEGVPGLAFLVPSLSTSASVGPGYFAIPFWYWIISIALLVVVHEGLHGVMFARDKLKIKSLGWGLLAVIPLAFVEPDEKQLAKQKPMIQLRAFAAGSFANFMLAGACFLILVTAFSGLFISTGVAYQGVLKDYPAQKVNLTGTIIRIENFEINSNLDLQNALEKAGPNKTITVVTLDNNTEKTFTLETVPEPEPVFVPDFTTNLLIGLDQSLPGTIEFSQQVPKALGSLFAPQQKRAWRVIQAEIKFWEYAEKNYPLLESKAERKIAELQTELQSYPRQGFIGIVGVFNAQQIKAEFRAYQGPVEFSQGLLFFMFIINFGVGVFNLLPLKPLDGGRMWELVFKRLSPKRYKDITAGVSYITLLIIVLSFMGPFF